MKNLHEPFISRFQPWLRLFPILVVCLAQLATQAQTFTTVATFSGSNGSQPLGTLVQGKDGNFYGTTQQGGDLACGAPYGCGAVIKMTPSGTLTVLHSFESTDGLHPEAGLVQGSDGNFYGTTIAGGPNSCPAVCGTIFKITPGGTLTTLYYFCSQANCADGNQPESALVQGSDGSFYGTTSRGGDMSCSPGIGCGTIFMITPTGSLTVLHTFTGSDGAAPGAPLFLASDGNFYGTTFSQGANNAAGGTVFKMTPDGSFTTLYSFCAQANCVDGSAPLAGLVEGGDGSLYGTTSNGGNPDCAPPVGCGTVFKIATSGNLSTLYIFCTQTNCSDGSNPFAALVPGSDGNFYGTTTTGGNTGCNYGCGTAFSISPAGKLTTLHAFAGSDGSVPQAGLVQASDGTFYGTTKYGGSSACTQSQMCGTIYRLVVSAGKSATATTVQVAPSTIEMGATTGVTLSAMVKPSSGSGTPTGTITFFNGTTQIGQAENLIAGTATANYDTSALGANSYSITAAYNGDTNYAASTSTPATLAVTSAQNPTSISLSISASPSASQSDLGSAVTFTATVAHTAGSASPTGSVTFLNGTSTLGTGSLNSNGIATFTTSSLSANQYSITAAYAGDGSFAGSTSSAAAMSVVDFQLTASPSSVSISAPGQSATAALTLTPLDGFSQAVTYTCTGLPAGAICSFVSSSTGASLTITTTAATTAALRRSSAPGSAPALALLLPGLLGLFTACGRKRRSRAAAALALITAISVGSFCLGCSGGLGSSGGGGGGGNSGTPTGSSSVVVTATAGSLSHQATVTLTVQ